MNPLTNQQQDICGYTGFFGALLSSVCFVQHLIIAKTHWVTITLVFIYIFIILAFSFLAFQKFFAPALLIVAGVLSLIAELLLILSGLFSLVVLLLFLYTIVIIIVVYAEGIPSKLREKHRMELEEKRAWEGKI